MSTLIPAYPRCFVGVAPKSPPFPARHCRLAGDGSVGIDWFSPPALHITLCFLGWLTAPECAAVREVLRAMGPPPPGEVSLTGETRVVGAEHTRSLVALVDPAPRLLDHQAALASALHTRLDRPDPAAPYWPHLTVARIAPGPLPPLADWTIDRLRLQARPPGLFAGSTRWSEPGEGAAVTASGADGAGRMERADPAGRADPADPAGRA